jgi:pyruvate,orthophosphate dikinase
MAEDPGFALSRDQAVERVGPDARAAARLATVAAATEQALGEPVARGLGASPGRVSGQAVFSSDDAADADDDGAGDLVLIRPETSPEDVPGMAVAARVVTATGMDDDAVVAAALPELLTLEAWSTQG